MADFPVACYLTVVTETQFQVVRGVGFVLALALALLLQRLRPHTPLRANWRVNGGLWAIDALVTGTVCGACACTVARWAAAHGLGALNLVSVPHWLALPTTAVVLDLVSYVWHRANHRLPMLWRFHQVHHADTDFTAATALRFHPGELVLSLPLRLAAIAVLGAPVAGVAIFELVFTTANFLEHGNIQLPLAIERPLARILVTPALHRRHHSTKRVELDSNFGTIFTVWDRLLGTYGASSSSLRFRTGLPGGQPPQTLWAALTLPLRGSDHDL